MSCVTETKVKVTIFTAVAPSHAKNLEVSEQLEKKVRIHGLS